MKKIAKKIGAVICSIILITGTASVAASAEADYSEYFALMRGRWESTLTGGDDYDRNDEVIAEKINDISETAAEYYSSMTDKSTWDTNGTKGYIWADLDPMTLSNFEQYSAVSSMYTRLKEMALAYRIGNDSLRGQDFLKTAIFDAMEWLNDKWFNPDIEQYGNWYYWQLGIPLAINDVLILMYGELPDGMLQNYMDAIDAFPPRQGHVLVGANQIWYCTVLSVRGALGGDTDKIERAVAGIKSVMPYVTSGDGFYADGSFVQHNMYAYTGGYGSSLIKNLTPVLQMLADTPWEPEEEDISNIYNWIYDSFEPLFYKGAFMDMVRGREISRYANTSYDTGGDILEAIVRIIQFAPEEDAEYFKSLVKYMVAEGSQAYDFYANASIDTCLLMKEIMEDDSVSRRDEYNLFKMYSSMDRAVQHTANYSAGISMHSERIAAFEKINGENIKGWYTGSGMLYLYNNDLTQFTDNFWCTVDSRRLPGTTVLRGVDDLPAEVGDVNALGRNSWAGGTGVLGLYGTVGMQLQPVDQTLDAKKSYFLFDNEIVCLGAGITASDGGSIETTVENRKLNSTGDNAFTVDGVEKSSELGYSENLQNVTWAYLEGNAEGSDIGYYFPEGASFNVLREQRSGCWSDVNQLSNQKDDTVRTNNYLTMYIDHGTTPESAGYSYVLLPGMSENEVEEYASSSDITVLANNEDVQSVRDDTLGVTGANFWNNKETTVYETVNGESREYLTVNSKASVMVAEQGGEIEISVSDPTQENGGLIGIELNRSAASVVSKDERVTVLQTSPSVVILVDVSGSNGQSITITLEAGEAAEPSAEAPEIISNGRITVRSTETVTSPVEITGTRPISFELSDSATEGLTIDRFGMLSIDADLPAGTYEFEITASNEYGSDTESFTLAKRNSELSAYWSFDEGEGTAFGDTVNPDRQTELANSPVWSADGVSGSCMEFPEPTGSAAPVAVVKTTNDLTFADGIEIELSVQFYESPVNGRTQILLEKRAATGTSYVPYALRVSDEGKIGLCWNGNWYESGSLEWQENTWYSIFVRHDGQKIVFERDGVSCGAVPNTDKNTFINSYFAIGAGRVNTNDYFVGKIDEVILSTPYEKGGLQITSADSFTIIPGVADSFTVTVNDWSKPVNFGLYGAPDGVSIDQSGVITVDADVPQDTYLFYVTASYTDELDAVQAFILTVGEPVPEAEPSGSVVYWNFNEGAGTIAATKSTLSTVSASVDFSAKLSGGTEWSEGFVGYGVHFGAKANIIDVVNNGGWSLATSLGMNPNASGNQFGGGVEYDFWVKFDVSPIGREQYIISRRNEGGNIPYAIKVTSDGRLAYCWSNVWTEGEALSDWKTDEWYHINVTRMSDGTVTLKRDGIVVGTGVNTEAYTNSGGGLVVNHTSRATSSNYFAGTLDEFYMGALGGGEEIVMRSKVSFETDGGDEIAPQYVWLNENAAAPETPEKPGCEFIGWYTDSDFTDEFDFDTPITGDITLYAKWKIIEKIPEAEAPEGTTIYWNFNEGEGTEAASKTNIADVDLKGTISGAQWVDGFIGSGLSFTKQSDSIRTIGINWPLSINLDNAKQNGGVEFDFWVSFNVSPLERTQVICRRVNEGQAATYFIGVDDSGRINFGWGGVTSNSDSLSDWKPGEWYHINVTMLKGGEVTFKRDGIVVGKAVNNGPRVTSSGQFGINTGSSTNSSNWFNGIIDEFFIGAYGASEKITLRSKVTFDSNGGSEVSPQYVFSDECAAYEAPVKEGAEFLGWYTDAELSEKYDFDVPVTGDITLYAGWESDAQVSDIILETDNIVAGRKYELIFSVLPDTAASSVKWSVKDSAGAEVTIADGAITADRAGEYTITATIENGISEGVDFVKDFTVCAFDLGDVNQDGSVDVRDLVRLKKLSADMAGAADNPLADIDGDSVFDSVDIAEIKKLLLLG